MCRKLFLLLIATLVTGCSDVAGPRDARVEAQLSAAGVVVTNYTSAPIYYFAVERETAGVINWGPCVGAGCPSLAPLQSIIVPYDQLTGWQNTSTEAIVYWWREELSIEGEPGAGRIRAQVVKR